MEIQGLHKLIYTIGRITPNGVNLLGTCFLLNKQGLFATACHVPNNDNNNLVIFVSDTTDLYSYQDTSNNKGQLISVAIYKVDPIRDICILKIEDNPSISNIKIGGTDDVKVSENLTLAPIDIGASKER